MLTFKQYLLDEMGGATHTDYVSKRTGQYNDRLADKQIRPILQDADRLLRRKDRMNPMMFKNRANTLINTFVDTYDKLGDEATELKARIADKYTQIKKLLQTEEQPLEDCVQILQHMSDILKG